MSRSAKPAANKKAIKKAKKEPSPELCDFDDGDSDGDSDDQDQSIFYELKTKNDRMVRKIQCTMDNGNVAVVSILTLNIDHSSDNHNSSTRRKPTTRQSRSLHRSPSHWSPF